MIDRTPPDTIDMRQIATRALVILACVAAAHCGGDDDSNPTNPTPPPSGGGGGGGGGTITAPTTDTEFDDGQWQDIVEAYGAGGTGGGGRLTYLGQAGAYYRQVTIDVNNAGSGSAAQVAVFSYKQNAVYFPTTDGAILSVDYSESSINQSSGGNVQYGAPAIRQNGKNYTLVPGGKAFTIPETSWTNHSLTGLTQNDFRTIASPSDHPDFSTNGGRIEVGFMRLQVVQPNASNAQTRAGIDNFQLVLIRRN